MDNRGYIKIDRKILDWGWYQNPNTFRVWMHLLLTANYTETRFQAVTIRRGEVLLNYQRIGSELGISYQSVRTAVNHLKSTGELTARKDSGYVVISIVNYDEYQSYQQANQQPINTASTADQHSLNTNKTNKANNKYIYARARGELENVFLTDDEVEELKAYYPTAYEKLINDVGLYKAKSGTDYASDYAACISFAINQGVAKAQPDLGYEITTEFDIIKDEDGYEVARPKQVKVYKDGTREPMS